ncbi:MAG: HXXEE domain-containing protein [Terriglobales bacterium]
MNLGDSHQRFGVLWLFFGYSLALHTLDEAGHDFLAYYNPNVLAIRRAWPSFFMPILTLQSFVGILLCVLAVWLALAPLAFRRPPWLRILAVPVALLGGIANGCAHMIASIDYRRLMPGVYTAPLILIAGILLLRDALRSGTPARPARS